MKLLSLLAVATIFTLLVACDDVSTAPSAAPPVTLTDVQVSMFGTNGTFTSDGAVLRGRTFQMTANARFSSGGKDVTTAASWTSSNPRVAPISSGGVLTGLANGMTIVTATYEGRSGSLPVMVSDIP